MKRKLLSFIFSFLVLFLPSLVYFNNKAYAKNVPCNATANHVIIGFTYTPENPATTDTSINLHIDKSIGGLADGTYTLTANQIRNNSISYYFVHPGITFSGDNQTADIAITSDVRNPLVESNLYINLYPAGNVSVPVCSDQLLISNPGGGPGPGPDPDCKVILDFTAGQTGFTTHEGIRFHVEGLQDNPDNKRGLGVVNVTESRPVRPGTCLTNKQLSDGYTVSTDSGNSLSTGDYYIRVSEKCFPFFDTPDGDPICRSPTDFCVSPDGKCRKYGSRCDLNKNGTGQKNTDCSDLTPYCIETTLIPDPAEPDKQGICSKAPSIVDKCDTEGHKGQCDTAIGYFGFEPDKFAKSVLALILSLAGGIVLLFLIINGYKLMTSSGDPEKVKEAKESIISAIAGLLFIIFSLVLLQFLTVDILQLPDFTP